jgi:uncharacterized protein (DUF58 family)
MQHSLVSERETLAKHASFLRLSARTIADSMKAGSFRSLYRGQGVEFSGVREYIRGDDIRSIDWNVTARLSRPYVKLFEEEHEFQIFLIVDCSYSMFTGSAGRTKYRTAAEAAALIAFAAEQISSPVGAVFFDGIIRFSCSPQSGPKRTMMLLTKLDESEQGGTEGSALAGALTGAGKLLRKRSLVFIFSDFRSAGWEEPFAYLAQHHDIIAMRTTSSIDRELPPMGTVPFADSETGIRLVLPTFSASFQTAWRNDDHQRKARWQNTCLTRGALPLEISTEDDPVRVLMSFFSRKRQI